MSITRRQFLGLLALVCVAIYKQSRQRPHVRAQMDDSVLVIGAGMAGLAAARTLHDAGYQVTVIEGRERIGGRLWTDRSMNGVALDLGASWIHGVQGNPLTALADQINVQRIRTDYDNVIVYDGNGNRIRDAVLAEYESQFEAFAEAVYWRSEARDTDIALGTVVDQVVQSLGLSTDEVRMLNYLINAIIEQDYAADVSQLSAWWWDSGEAFSGGDVLFPQGYDQLLAPLMAGLDIRTNQMVKAIRVNDGVTVETDTDTFTADYAVVTIPLGVLKQNLITFDPPLEPWRQTVIDTLHMGVLNKTYLRFDAPFWDLDVEAIGHIDPNIKGRWAQWLNLYHYLGEPILLGFNAGAYGKQIEDQSDEAIIEEALSVLRTIYGEQVTQPTDYLITRWGQDPFTYGSYSSVGVGADPDQLKRFGEEAYADHVIFAGEATHADHRATVHGAYLSGIRAAEWVMS